jgi:outer membrane biosynthesis protein TonB
MKRMAMPVTTAWTFKRGLRVSLIVHGALVLFIVLKALVFPSTVKPFIPSLRVDLVGLPDMVRKDLERLKTLPMPKAGEESESEPEKVKVKSDPEAASPDELVLKPKAGSEGKTSKADKAKDRAKKALARIKALEKINEADETPADDSAVVKGNIVSKGSALSGNAKETAEQSYYEGVLAKLQANWALPIWLSRQSLSAQVQVFIDGRGRVKLTHFMKSSGNPQFDDAVKRAIAASEPFQVPPDELRSSLLNHGILLGFPL